VVILSIIEFVKKARDLGINLENYLREQFQKLILYVLVALGLSDFYVFQGGSALRIIYGSPRFSLDMDFTIIKRSVDSLMEDSERIARRLELLMARDNITVEKRKEKVIDGDLLRYFISFDTRGILEKKIKIKMELVIRKYVNVRFKRIIVTIDYPERLAFGVVVKTPEQILADKLASLAGGMRRGYIRWRDIFDIYWIKTHLKADLDKEYFRQEFGSWIERPEDLKVLYATLKNLLNSRDFSEFKRRLSLILPSSLVSDDLLAEYIRTTLHVVEKALELVG